MENPKSEEDDIEIMMNDKADEIIEELFYSTENRYQNNLELKIASESVFDYVHLFYYKFHKTNGEIKKDPQRISKIKPK